MVFVIFVVPLEPKEELGLGEIEDVDPAAVAGVVLVRELQHQVALEESKIVRSEQSTIVPWALKFLK